MNIYIIPRWIINIPAEELFSEYKLYAKINKNIYIYFHNKLLVFPCTTKANLRAINSRETCKYYAKAYKSPAPNPIHLRYMQFTKN